jgi:hypothetical protein
MNARNHVIPQGHWDRKARGAEFRALRLAVTAKYQKELASAGWVQRFFLQRKIESEIRRIYLHKL